MASTETKADTDEVRGGFGGLGGEPTPLAASSPSKPARWWQEVTSAPLSMSATAVNLVDTLPYMEGRKSLRRFRGAYMKTRPLLSVVLFLVLLALWAYRSSLVTNESVSATFALVIGVQASTRAVYIVLLTLVLIYLLVSVRLLTQYNLAFGWVITAVFILLCLIDILVVNAQPDLFPFQPSIRDGLLGLFLFAQGSYIFASWLLTNTIPFLQMRGWFLINVSLLEESSGSLDKRLQADIPTDPRFRAVPKTGLMASSTYTYVQVLLPIFRPFVWKKQALAYSGEVDKEGRPHGYGVWSDSQWHGETLEGWWSHGVPISPFKARETGSGSGFVAIRMGYVKCRADGLRELLFAPMYEEITVGVASAECSVSGFFFRNYPIVRFMAEPFFPEEIAKLEEMKQKPQSFSEVTTPRKRDPVESLKSALNWVSKQIIPSAFDRNSSTVVITADKSLGLNASGFYLEDGTQSSGPIESISLVAEKCTQEDTAPESAGQTGPSPLQPSQQKMDKRFSGSIKLSGWNSCYTEQDREAILYIHGYNSPVEWGVKTLGQLMALGNYPSYLKPFVFSWPTGQLYCFLPAKRAAVADTTTGSLIETMKALDRAGFKKLHILTHSMGARVLMAAIPQMTGLLQKSRSADGSGNTRSGASMENGLTIPTITLLNPELGLSQFLRSGAKPLRELSPVVTIFGDLKDSALFGSAPWNSFDAAFMSGTARRRRPDSDLPTNSERLEEDDFCCCGAIPYERSLGTHLYSIKGPHGEPLDIDVIDTTFLEANINQVRHNSFALNRDIVEDVRDIMTTGRRATERSRLEARGGNVFSFLVAPAHVVQF